VRRRLLVFGLVFGGLLAYQVWALAVVDYGVPEVEAGRSPVWLGEVAGPVTVAQTFRVDANGLSSVTVRARPAGASPRPDLDVVFEVAEVGDDRSVRPLFRMARRLDEVVATRRYTIGFPPIADSVGRRFRVEIGVPLAGAGEGIELLASREPRHGGGAAYLGGREHWGDLEFSATADGATAVPRLEARLASWPEAGVRAMLGVLFVSFNAVLGLFVWIAVGGRERSGMAPRSVRATRTEPF
jgi:hypothetical protein